jgi:hypothetical protein
VLLPIRSGIVADQLLVPEAVPDAPVLVDHVTLATAVLPEEVPANVRDCELVAIVVPPGEIIDRVGGVVSVPPGLGGVGAGGAGAGAGAGVGAGVGVGVGVGTLEPVWAA